ncbi:MAG: hypothetical protein QOC72_561, partial [Methylobacteriaceae bacterium]|nr:hypothetical protein [Methylobacteriaceae bacterium]
MSIGDGTEKQPNSADAAHPSEQKSKAAQIDLGELSREIGELMLLYCDAIGACTGIPRFSMLRLPTLFLRYLWWYLCLFAFFPVAAIDIVILAIRAIFGRPRVLVGRRLYARLKLPLLSAWSGQIPAILVFRWRYLARLLLFYRAQLTMNALHRAFNRRQLDLLFFSQEKEVADAEKFQKSFDLFQRITTDSYQIRALAIGGPLVALLAYAVQSAIQKAGPFVSSLWAAYV